MCTVRRSQSRSGIFLNPPCSARSARYSCTSASCEGERGLRVAPGPGLRAETAGGREKCKGSGGPPAGSAPSDASDELLALAAATRNAIRNMRNDYQTLLHQSSQALARLEDDEEVELTPRLRLAVRQLLIEREILANLLNAHPNLRQEAGQLRISAEETFPEESSSEDEL